MKERQIIQKDKKIIALTSFSKTLRQKSGWMSLLTICHVLCLLGISKVVGTDIMKLETLQLKTSTCGDDTLLGGVDKIVFRAVIAFSSPDATVTSEFQNPRSKEWEKLCGVPLATCQLSTNLLCRCFGNRSWTVVVNWTADSSYARSAMRMVFQNATTSTYSEESRLPDIVLPITEELLVDNTKIALGQDSHSCLISSAMTKRTSITYLRDNSHLFGSEVTISSSLQPPAWLKSYENSAYVRTSIQLVDALSSNNISNQEITLQDKLIISYNESDACKRKINRVCTLTEYSTFMNLDPFKQAQTYSKCASGVLVGETFYFQGLVDTTGINTTVRRPVYLVQVGQPENFTTVARIDVEKDGCGPQSKTTQPYCERQAKDVHHLIVTLTAQLASTDESFVKLVWEHEKEGKVDQSQTRRLPAVQKNFTSRLKIDDHEEIELINSSDLWHLRMTRNKPSTIQFCIASNESFFTVMVKTNNELIKLVTYQTCVAVRYIPSCDDINNIFQLSYTESGACRRSGSYTNKGLVPVLEVDNLVVDIENPNCIFQWPETNTNPGKVIKFCTINLSKPYTLTALMGKEKISTTDGPCLTMQELPRSGQLVFKAQSDCEVEPSYACRVKFASTEGASITAGDVTLNVSEDCSLEFKKDHNVSITICFFILTPPYTVKIDLSNNSSNPLFEGVTNACFDFFVTSTNVYLFNIIDSLKETRSFQCYIMLHNFDLAIHEDNNKDSPGSSTHRGDSPDFSTHRGDPPDSSTHRGDPLDSSTHRGGSSIEGIMVADNKTFRVYTDSCSLVLKKGHSTAMQFCIMVLEPPYKVTVKVEGLNNNHSIEGVTNECFHFEYKPISTNTLHSMFSDANNISRKYHCSVTWETEGNDTDFPGNYLAIREGSNEEGHSSTAEGKQKSSENAGMWSSIARWAIAIPLLLTGYCCIMLWCGIPGKKRHGQEQPEMEDFERNATAAHGDLYVSAEDLSTQHHFEKTPKPDQLVVDLTLSLQNVIREKDDPSHADISQYFHYSDSLSSSSSTDTTSSVVDAKSNSL